MELQSWERRHIEYEADGLARACELDRSRVRAVFYRLLEANWLAPAYPRRTALDEAIESVGASRAIEIFEGSDLQDLAWRVATLRYLMDSDTPLYDIPRLARLLEAFSAHLQCNRHSLVRTGHPETSFAASPYLDAHLTRLYFVKMPLTMNDSPAAASQRLAEAQGWVKHDSLGNVLYAYSWVKERYPMGPPLPGFGLDSDGSRTGGTGGHIGGDKPVTLCAYEDAGIIREFSAKGADRLNALRPALFDARASIVDQLARAIRLRDTAGLWEGCLGPLRGALTDDDARFLLSADALIAELEGPGTGVLVGDIPHNAGLSDLFTVIGHCEKEITIGAMDRTAQALHAAIGMFAVGNYYEALDHPAQGHIDSALDDFRRLEVLERDFLASYRGRVASAVARGFPLRTPAPSAGATDAFRPDDIAARVMELLEGRLTAAATTPPAGRQAKPMPALPSGNSFRRDGAVWTVSYGGETKPVRHLKGMSYLAFLLAHPGREFAVLELVREVDGTPVIESRVSDDAREAGVDRDEMTGQEWPGGGGDEIMDESYRRDIEMRLRELGEEIRRARLREDLPFAQELEQERAAIQRIVRAATDRHSRTRRMGSVTENARQSVQKNIRRAIKSIAASHRSLADHLDRFVHTGHTVRYLPHPPTTWQT